MRTSWLAYGVVAALLSTAPGTAVGSYGEVPRYFEANAGQWDSAVCFVTRGRGYTAFVTPTEAVLRIAGARVSADAAATSSVVRLQLAGSDGGGRVVGERPLPGRVNYYVGRDPARWRSDVRTYQRVRHRAAYPGIDVVYHGGSAQLEYDFVVAPGADPGRIRLRIVGAEVRHDADGDLLLNTDAGTVRLPRPVVYQRARGGTRRIAARYAARGASEVGFAVASYDRRAPLIIDPLVIIYSTFLGGSVPMTANLDGVYAIAVNESVFALSPGPRRRPTFPTTRPRRSAAESMMRSSPS